MVLAETDCEEEEEEVMDLEAAGAARDLRDLRIKPLVDIYKHHPLLQINMRKIRTHLEPLDITRIEFSVKLQAQDGDERLS